MYFMVSFINRFSILLMLSAGGLCLQAQSSSTTTISTNPAGARFTVDGQLYNAAVTLVWPSGSEHFVVFVTDAPTAGQSTSTLVQTAANGTTQYVFNGWVDNKGLLQPTTTAIQVVTADPSITTLTAQVTLSYRVNLSFYNSGSSGGSSSSCGAPGAIPAGQSSPGVVYVNSVCYWNSAVLYVAANSTVILNAYPYPGYVFTGWAINSAAPSAFLTSFTLNSPTTITPLFEPAKRVSFLTSPLGLNLLIDHTTIPTRSVADVPNCPYNETEPLVVQTGFPPLCFGDFDYAPGSTHSISGVTPQRDQKGNWWVFSSWSNGAGQAALYTVDNNPTVAVTLTANYVAGAQVSFVTTPGGLKLSVDGRSNWSSYDFVWGVGTAHTVSAAATQTGTNGRIYTFQGWSNQGSASQGLTVDQSMVNNGYRLTATFSELSRVVVQSLPSGLTLQVDGASCVTPCNVDRQTGATIHVTAPTQFPMGQGTRLDFGSWSDGGASDHVITVSKDYAVATASYNTSYQLSATSNPGNGASFAFSPSSSDLYYQQGTQVSVTASANAGFKFGHWTGALAGTYPSGSVSMSAPQAVVAQMTTVPYIAPAGIMNGAGQTPTTAVAPGSVISIFGESLASVVQVGPVNPLSQSIAGTSVEVNGTILPLLFVSAQQINAQLPSGLSDGSYTLQVHNVQQADISGTFTVARDAPGLFFSTIASTAYAMAFHANGSLVTTDSPAAGGETISLLGTGFGPYQTTLLDGFFPANPLPLLTDSVVLSVGGLNPTPTSTAAAGFTGVVSTSFQVPSGLPGGTSVPVLVTINGTDSNTVMLPIR